MTNPDRTAEAKSVVASLARSAEVLNDYYVNLGLDGQLTLGHELCMFGDPIYNSITLLELTNMAYQHEQNCEQAKLIRAHEHDQDDGD